tara:strand:- start:331 stop:537 length:207 start_codon:yes stop_codon:yes gene_type:complete
MNFQVNNKDNKWLSLRGNKINKKNIVYFNSKQINENIKKIVNTEFMLEFNIKKNHDKENNNCISWLII